MTGWEFCHGRSSAEDETTYFGMRFMAAIAGSESSASDQASVRIS